MSEFMEIRLVGAG